MRYTFDAIEIATPGQTGGTCGRIAPVTVEWDALAAEWPTVLGQGISAIKVQSTMSGLTTAQDILPIATIEAEYLCAIVAKTLSLHQHDEFWMEQMRLQWVIERRAAQAVPPLRLVKS